jgi:hypothetical protein
VQTNEPDSREFPHFIRRQEGQAWMKFTISSFSVRKVFQNKHTVHTHIRTCYYSCTCHCSIHLNTLWLSIESQFSTFTSTLLFAYFRYTGALVSRGCRVSRATCQDFTVRASIETKSHRDSENVLSCQHWYTALHCRSYRSGRSEKTSCTIQRQHIYNICCADAPELAVFAILAKKSQQVLDVDLPVGPSHVRLAAVFLFLLLAHLPGCTHQCS